MEFIKIRRGGELFWCKVLEKESKRYKVQVDNDLINQDLNEKVLYIDKNEIIDFISD